MKFILLFLIISLFISSCKKNYTCNCSNPGGTFEAFTIKTTKTKAKQKCKEYYSENYGAVVFNETSCEIK